MNLMKLTDQETSPVSQTSSFTIHTHTYIESQTYSSSSFRDLLTHTHTQRKTQTPQLTHTIAHPAGLLTTGTVFRLAQPVRENS